MNLMLTFSLQEQLKIFLDEAIFYFDKTGLEQQIKHNDELPSLEEFWEMRMGSSGTKPCLVLAEYVFGLHTLFAL
jgi:hypothetical protein